MKKALGTVSLILLMVLAVILMSVLIPVVMGFKPYVVISGSMEPKYPVGSIVFVKKITPEAVMPGDCISYKLGGMSVTHRVLSVDRASRVFITKGDANDLADQPVPFDNYIGKTSDFVIFYVGYVTMFIKSLPGFIALCLLGAGVAALAVFRGIRRFRPRHA